MYDLLDGLFGIGSELNKLLGPDIRKYRLQRALIKKGKTKEEAHGYVKVLEAFTPFIANGIHIPEETLGKLVPIFAEILMDRQLARIWFTDEQTIENVRYRLRIWSAPAAT
jgi:hypothetical protein